MRAFHRKGLTVFLLPVVFLYASCVFSKSIPGFLSQDCLPTDGGPPVAVYFFKPLGNTGITKVEMKVSVGKIGAVSNLGMGLFSIEYFPELLKKARSVEFVEKNTGAKRTFRACPYPAGRIVVSAQPKHLLAGHDQNAKLNISVWDNHGNPVTKAKLQVTANIGTVLGIRELGNGRYEAGFAPPEEPFPQVAIIMVAWPDGVKFHRVAVGRAVIPITARLDLPGKTEPGTRMKMTVAGKSFGPVTADSNGFFSLSILVPPGYGTGRATSVDRVGNRKSKTVNLYLPETNLLGIWAYPQQVRVGAGNTCRILVTTIDKFGSPMDFRWRKKRWLKILAKRGKIQATRRIAKGLFEAYYVPPDLVGDGKDEISVGFPGGSSKSHANIKLTLLPGPASRLTLHLPEVLAADGKSKGEIRVELFDELNNHAVGQVVKLYSDVGTLSSVAQNSPGVFTASLLVNPDPKKFLVQVRAMVEKSVKTNPAKLLVSADSLRQRKDGSFVLQAVLTDSLGNAVAGKPVDFKVQESVLHSISAENGRVEFVLPKLAGTGLHHGLLSADGGLVRKSIYLVRTGRKVRLLPIELAVSLPKADPLVAFGQVTLYPPTSVILFISVGPESKDRSWRVVDIFAKDPGGKLLGGRKIKLSASMGKPGKLMEVSPGHYRSNWTPGDKGWSKATLSAFDMESEVGAIIEVRE